MNHEDNHGKVGEAMYLNFTLENFNKQFNSQSVYSDKTELSIEELQSKYNISAGVPIIIDYATKGDYECVCENGIEIHYFED